MTTIDDTMDRPDSLWKDRAWYIYGGIAAVATLFYFAAGRSGYLFNAIGLSAPLAILIAVRLHKPARKAPWHLLALGMALFIAGDVITYNYPRLFGTEAPFPSIGDVLYLSVYPCLVLGLLLMVRLRTPGRDWTSLLDSLMVAVAVGTASWIFLMSPYWHDQESGLLARLTSMGYPLADLILIAVAVRLAVGAGRRVPSLILMLTATCALFLTDTIYAWVLLYATYEPGSGYLELGWAAFYIVLGMAALHPSMRSLTERAPEQTEHMGWARLAMLLGAALVPPTIRLAQYLRHEPVDNIVLIGATFTLFVLVVLRMAGLVRLQERYTARERALREAGAALVTATNRDSIRTATIEAVKALAGSDAVVRVCERDPGRPSEYIVTAGDEAVGTSLSLDKLQERERQSLIRGESHRVALGETRFHQELKLGDGEGWTFVAGLSLGEELRGLLVASTRREMSSSVRDSLVSLSRQVALALDSAQLTEELLEQRSEARFASLIKNSSDVVAVIEPDTSIRYVTPSAVKVLGYTPSALEATLFADLIHPDDRPRAMAVLTSTMDSGHAGLAEFRIRHNDGTFRYAETLCTNLLGDPNVRGVVLTTRDISERKEFENQLAHQAFHDPVTGLANRALFRDRVLHALERQERDGEPVSVLFMDLDDFKNINDSLGHAAGDQVLREVGERLRRCLRAADTAARLGGDEYGVLLEEAGDGIQATDVADRLMQELEAPFRLEGRDVMVRASVGIAVTDGKGTSTDGADELLRNADVAMYMAKERGKSRYQVYEQTMHDTALQRLQLKGDLQRALEHKEFLLYYQPVVDLQTGSWVGVEALLRWQHPERGIVPPLQFIPLAEETGLIVPIGQWVLAEACRYAAHLRARIPSEQPFHMAVNLSARQLQDPLLIADVRRVLDESGLEPSALILEITESVMMQDIDASLVRLRDLKKLGVRLAIDDFGTGYSSLNYVRRFPVDILKVDKSFIDGVGEGGESAALTRAVIELAGILKLQPVAEGIERSDQLHRLQEMSCDFGQGFLFSAPLPEKELEPLFAAQFSSTGATKQVAIA